MARAHSLPRLSTATTPLAHLGLPLPRRRWYGQPLRRSRCVSLVISVMSTPTPLTAHQPKPPPFGTAHRSPDVSQIPWRLLPQRRDSLPLNLSPSPKSSPPISTHERSSSLNTSWPSPRPRGQVRFDDEDDVAPAIPARPLSGPSRASNGSGFPAGLHEFLLAPMPEPHPRRRTDMLPFGPLDAHYGTLRPTMPINWKTQASSSLNESRRRRRASDALYAKVRLRLLDSPCSCQADAQRCSTHPRTFAQFSTSVHALSPPDSTSPSSTSSHFASPLRLPRCPQMRARSSRSRKARRTHPHIPSSSICEH